MLFIRDLQVSKRSKLGLLKAVLESLVKNKIAIGPQAFLHMNVELILVEGIHREMLPKPRGPADKPSHSVDLKSQFYTIFLEDLGQLFFTLLDKTEFSRLYRFFKVVRGLSHGTNDMEDLVKFRLEEAFGELFVEGLEVSLSSSRDLKREFTLEPRALELTAFVHSNLTMAKFLVPRHSFLLGDLQTERGFCPPQKHGSQSRFLKVGQAKFGREMLHFHYSYLSVFDLEIRSKGRTLSLKVNHAHLELIKLIRKIKGEGQNSDRIFGQFAALLAAKFPSTGETTDFKFLFRQILSNDLGSKSLYSINPKGKIAFSKGLFSSEQSAVDFSMEYLERLALRSRALFKTPKRAPASLSPMALQSKFMLHLKKNKSASKSQLAAAAFSAGKGSAGQVDAAVQALLAKALVQVDPTNPARLLFLE